MVEGYPSRIPVIRWRIPACANGYPPAGADSGADGPFSANRWRVSGYPKGYPRPGGEMAGWKETLPVDEVQVPRRLEGNPSSRSVAGPLEGGYPRIPARIPAAADGYPLAGAGADADSTAKIKPGQLYGTISTPSFITCNATDPIDYQILLKTNASVDHTLSTSFVYALAGNLLLLNGPAPPTLNYYLDMVSKVCRVEHQVDEATDKTFTSGPGLVILVLKPTSEPNNDLQEGKKMDLNIVVRHTDWDPEDRLVKSFEVKYIIPATPKLTNTHSMIRVGREFNFDGYLFGWDMKEHQAVIKVLGFSPLNVQNPGSIAKSPAPTPQSSPANKGRKFVTFGDAGLVARPDEVISPPATSQTTGADHVANGEGAIKPMSNGEGTSTAISEAVQFPDPDDAPLALSSPAKAPGRSYAGSNSTAYNFGLKHVCSQ
ncbi:hypothetical protein PGT21_029433 [Puccinia graminis f. sp. tritici]|uniref:Uncharacterized protein n=1 Tax=Puccinia graminis f. sp. tritici TaxID=56615 RepID=A0A5B0P888_PUCGR|nr:hypothetical protein PGT21_029433 [Puccinia graminis f. sp. tritici]